MSARKKSTRKLDDTIIDHTTPRVKRSRTKIPFNPATFFATSVATSSTDIDTVQQVSPLPELEPEIYFDIPELEPAIHAAASQEEPLANPVFTLDEALFAHLRSPTDTDTDNANANKPNTKREDKKTPKPIKYPSVRKYLYVRCSELSDLVL